MNAALLQQFASQNGLASTVAPQKPHLTNMPPIQHRDWSAEWQACVEDVTEDAFDGFGKYSGLGLQFLMEAHAKGWIGIYMSPDHGRRWAVPVRDGRGVIVGCRYNAPSGEWHAQPAASEGCVFFAGNQAQGGSHIFGSPWDAFKIMEAVGEIARGEAAGKIDSVIVRFGDESGEVVGQLTKECREVYCWPTADSLDEDSILARDTGWCANIAAEVDEFATLKCLQVPSLAYGAAAWCLRESVQLQGVLAVLPAARHFDRSELGDADDGFPRMIDACHLMKKPPTMPDEVVHGLLHQGSKMVLGGGSKSCKTWSLLELGMCVATGADWWEFPTTKGRVLYVNFELQPAFLAKRLEALQKICGKPMGPGEFITWNLRGHAADINDLEGRILERCAGRGFVLIIFDPLYKMLGDREENSAGDIAHLLNVFERIAHETGAAVVFGAHFSKGNQAAKESIDRIGGSGVFGRDPDTILTMTKHEENDAYTVDAILRNHAAIEPFVVRWHFPTMRRDTALDPSKLKVAKSGREPRYTDDDMIVPLKSGAALAIADWKNTVKELSGMSDRTFFSMKKQLIAQKKVHKVTSTGKWTVT